MGRRWWVAGVAAVAVAAAGIAFAVAPDIPYGLRVVGIPIGGKTETQAAQALRAGLADRAALPYRVLVQDRATWITPGEVALAVNIPATLARASARGAFAAVSTGREVEPVVDVDEARLYKALKGTVDQLGTPLRLPWIGFEGLTAKPFYGVPGKGLDLKKTADAVTRSWLRAPQAVLTLEEIFPASSDAEVDRVLAGLAVPAVAAPVSVRTEAGDLQIRPEQIAASLVIDSDELGRLRPHVDETLLRAAMRAELDAFEAKAREAGVVDGVLVASEPGLRLDTGGLAAALMEVLGKVGENERVVAGTVRAVDPLRSSAELDAWGITERVSTFTTSFSGGPTAARTINIVTGAKKIDGMIVRPGETFSLNAATGPRGYAEGYKDAPIIMNGRLSPGVGGGMSQLTTTLFNAAYYAGMIDVEHRPHTIYFPTYPSVIEATIFYPSLDLKFRNDTDFGILIDTSWTDSSITVSLWSTKVYESVTTEWGPRSEFTAPGEKVVPAADGCIAREGTWGFKQEAWRILKKRGEQVKREKFSWRYDAEPRVTCA